LPISHFYATLGLAARSGEPATSARQLMPIGLLGQERNDSGVIELKVEFISRGSKW